MGQVTQFFQPPLYWQQFEDLTQSVVELAYGVAMADKIGRPGQAQDGVDGFPLGISGIVSFLGAAAFTAIERSRGIYGLQTAARLGAGSGSLWNRARSGSRDSLDQNFGAPICFRQTAFQ
jgi:hypothetical protein